MKIDFKAIGADLAAKALPMAEKDLIIAIDSILSSIQAQAIAQPGDMIAGIIAIGMPEIKIIIDAELAKLMPAAAP